MRSRFLLHLQIPTLSLAFFRIFLAISVLYNLVFVKLTYITEFYGANPFIPQNVFQSMNGTNSFSVFDWIRNDAFAYVFFSLGIIAATSMLFGIFTRYATIITTFIFWNFLQASSTYIFGFDFYAFQLLFWACFLPLDGHWTVHKKTPHAAHWLFGFIVQYQIIWVYFATGLVKYGESWLGGYAVHNMLLDMWATTPLAAKIANYSFVYTPLTYLTLVFEILFPLFFLLPSRKDILRYILVLFLCAFHIGIFATYNVGNFSLTGLAAACLLLPQSFWQKKWFLRFESVQNFAVSEVWASAKYLRYGLVLIAFYVISIKNIVFVLNYSALKDNEGIKALSAQLEIINPRAIAKVSFFTQFWKMFAPNPPVKAGWLALEIEKTDGKTYNYLTNDVVDTKNATIQWTPSGYEYYLMQYARNFDFPDSKSDKFKVFLKYWILHKVTKSGVLVQKGEKLYLTDYNLVVERQEKKPRFLVNMHNAEPLVNQKFGKIEIENNQ